jgi:hypothetical protein
LRRRLFTGLFISILIIAGCARDNHSCGILKIEYGTSFGECWGFCNRYISIAPDEIVFTKTGWADSVITRHCSEEISKDDYRTLTAKIQLSEFNQMDEIIGCPDCADGGAEWIRIVRADNDKKVTFEFGNEPDEVKSFIQTLRDYLKGFENCN